ncbi:MAG: GNAT family N-acetyltransferase [Lentisphaeria bacterium]|nr:GNAT family N-acetyltransferase [Lentisphaeria bacterium]
MSANSSSISFRPAVPDDIPGILELLEEYVRQQLVLPRTAEELQNNYRNFIVAVNDDDGKIVGAVALRPFEGGYFEVRSLAVASEYSGSGLGSKLVAAVLKRAETLRPIAKCVFALTKRPNLFHRLGFRDAPHEAFPGKIWADCLQCPKYHCCDEDAVEYHLD